MICEACLQKQQEIDRLKTINENLLAKLYQQKRSIREKPFGSNTPSSKINLKPNTEEERSQKQGGAKVGHQGYGRCCDGIPDEIIDVPAPETCPECGSNLIGHGETTRHVKDLPAIEVKTIRYQIKRGFCPQCQKTVVNKNLPALPNSLLGNQLLAHIVEQHYLYDVSIGQLAEQLNIGKGTLIGSLHRLRKIFKPVLSQLILDWRQSPVKHADETSWRNNGHSGYAWLFASKDIALFYLRKTRSSSGLLKH